MTLAAQGTIQQAIDFWKQAKKTAPPCPVFTAAAIALYDDAIQQLTRRRDELQRVLDAERSADSSSASDNAAGGDS